MLEACVLATMLCGFFGIIFKKNLVMKIISMDIMSTGGYCLLCTDIIAKWLVYANCFKCKSRCLCRPRSSSSDFDGDCNWLFYSGFDAGGSDEIS